MRTGRIAKYAGNRVELKLYEAAKGPPAPSPTSAMPFLAGSGSSAATRVRNEGPRCRVVVRAVRSSTSIRMPGRHDAASVSSRTGPFSHGRHLRPELAGAVGDDSSTDPVENEENDDGASEHATEERQHERKIVTPAVTARGNRPASPTPIGPSTTKVNPTISIPIKRVLA